MTTLIGVIFFLIGSFAYYRAWKIKNPIVGLCGAIFFLAGAIVIVGWNGSL